MAGATSRQTHHRPRLIAESTVSVGCKGRSPVWRTMVAYGRSKETGAARAPVCKFSLYVGRLAAALAGSLRRLLAFRLVVGHRLQRVLGEAGGEGERLAVLAELDVFPLHR